MANDTEAPLPSDLPASAPVLNDIEAGTHTANGNGTRSSQHSPTPSGTASDKKVKKGGRTEGDELMPELPNNNLKIVMPCKSKTSTIVLTLHQIIATALPTIATKFNATPSEYSWVATAYQLAMTLLTPINGRVSDIIGRKPLLYAAIIIFTIFSAVCGCAKSMTWLITARAFQGLGGGSIIGLTNIVVSDIVPLEKRGQYQGFMGGAWGVASVLGPILGGLLTQKASWRWCFWINLPTCAVAFVLLAMTLKLNPPRGGTFADLRHTFDFIGLFLIMVSGSLLIVGFSFAADHGFGYKPAIALIVVGGVLFICAIINCLFTKRLAVIPARALKVRTTAFWLVGSSLHACAFIPSNLLLPQFFQGVRGADALQSGIQLLPYAIFVSLSTVVAGQIVSQFRIVRPVPWVGYAIAMVGFGAMIPTFTYTLPLSEQYGLLIIPAFGIGLSLQTPLVILQAAMPLSDMAAVTAAWTLTRSLGGSVGVSIFTAILNTEIRTKFSRIPGYGVDFVAPTSSKDYEALHAMPEGPLRDSILGAFADSFTLCWIVSIALFGGALAITLPTKAYSLRRPRAGAAATAAEKEQAEREEAEAVGMGGAATAAVPFAAAIEAALAHHETESAPSEPHTLLAEREGKDGLKGGRSSDEHTPAVLEKTG